MDNPNQEEPVIMIIKPPRYTGRLVFSEAANAYIPEAEAAQEAISEVTTSP